MRKNKSDLLSEIIRLTSLLEMVLEKFEKIQSMNIGINLLEEENLSKILMRQILVYQGWILENVEVTYEQ